MSFAPTISLSAVSSSRPGTMNGSDKLFLDRSRREIAEKLNAAILAIVEMQEWLVANT